MLNWETNSNGVCSSQYDYKLNFRYVVNHTLGVDKPWFARKMRHGVESIECNTFDTKDDAISWCNENYIEITSEEK